MPFLKYQKLVLGVFFVLILAFFFFVKTSNAATTHVVISEVQIGETGHADNEFVELYNPTDSSVDLTGWRLTKKISSGTESLLDTSVSGTIASHGHFLIAHPTGYTGATTSDNTYSSSSYSVTTNNTVLLYSDAGNTLVDKVGMGTAVDFESVAATLPGSLKSIERFPLDSDTDNNANDFVLRDTPNPQNSTFIETTSTPVPSPSVSPTASSSPIETATPSTSPTESPTESPTAEPSTSPTISPTISPTVSPSTSPTESPTSTVSPLPSLSPTPVSTLTPTPTVTSTPISFPTHEEIMLRFAPFRQIFQDLINKWFILFKFPTIHI